jgi:hypothetical protein
MAYIGKEKKQAIRLALKEAGIPNHWRWTIRLNSPYNSTVSFNLWKSDGKLHDFAKGKRINPYYLENFFEGEAEEYLDTFKKIKDALNTDNYDNSDVMTDYFDVGHYIEINIENKGE